MGLISTLIDFILHIDTHLGQIIETYGQLTYAILFGIVFLETGLVFTPFLPGDSLLFAAGAFAAIGSLNIYLLLVITWIAAVLGDTVNYWIGHFFGQKIIDHPRIPLDQKHIDQTQKFFDIHGGKTIILARFIPIVRTFAPFVAGVGKMSYSQFVTYNIIGATLWVGIAVLSGYFFGNIPFIQEHFSIVILVVIALSIVPIIFEFITHKLRKK